MRSVRDEGFMSLYRGMGSRLASNCIQSSFMFGANSAMRDLVGADQSKPFSQRFALAALLTGCLEACMYTPFELIKVRAQTAVGSRVTSVTCAKEIISAYGLGGLYWGIKPTLIREGLGNLVYFTSYYAFRKELVHEEGTGIVSPFLGIALSGGFAGVAFWATVHPVDTLKTILTSDSVTNPEWPTSMVLALRKLISERGLLSLYRGIVPSLARAFIGNACQFVAFETVLDAL